MALTNSMIYPREKRNTIDVSRFKTFRHPKDIAEKTREIVISDDDEEPPDIINERTEEAAKKDIRTIISNSLFRINYDSKDYGIPEKNYEF
jgi:hypothetical protein